MNFLLVLRGVFSHAVKPGIRVMSFPKYLTNLNHDGRCIRFRTGIPRVGFSHTVPAPAETVTCDG